MSDVIMMIYLVIYHKDVFIHVSYKQWETLFFLMYLWPWKGPLF